MNGNGANSQGWFKATRGYDALELIRKNPNAYALAAIIAHRARWTGGYNADGLDRGEALLGDHNQYGMTRQEYRTAILHLLDGNFATFRATNRGTIARLKDTRLFDPLNIGDNQQNNPWLTSEQPTSNHSTTTNKEIKKDEKENNDKVSKSLVERGSGGKPILWARSKLSAHQKELVDRFEKALGDQWVNDAGKWVNRIKSDPAKCERVIADLENARKERLIETTPAQYAENNWMEFQ